MATKAQKKNSTKKSAAPASERRPGAGVDLARGLPPIADSAASWEAVAAKVTELVAVASKEALAGETPNPYLLAIALAAQNIRWAIEHAKDEVGFKLLLASLAQQQANSAARELVAEGGAS